jgi:flagellin
MSSILTNTGAMVALTTLKSINSDLAKTQSMISTGKNIANARDNSAVWAISKVMEADVKGFKGIQDSLSLGESTVAVGRKAAETVTKLLTDIKGKIVAAQESNVDREKIQTDIDALRDQIETVVGAAQFNGLNLVDGTQTTVNVLSSLDRDVDGNVSVSNIEVEAQDLSIGEYTANDVFAVGGGTATVSTDADTFILTMDKTGGTNSIAFQDGATAWAEGDRVSMTVAGNVVNYTVTASDLADGDADGTPDSSIPDLIAIGLKNAIDRLGIEGLDVGYDSGTPGQLDFTNNGDVDMTITGQFKNAGSGGLGALTSIDVSDGAAAATALGNIEDLIQTSIDAAASLGSVEGRINTQAEFIDGLSKSLKTGIGALVDADMEETSARLQALQVQQQLGIQSLSIANQAPQSILSLFR